MDPPHNSVPQHHLMFLSHRCILESRSRASRKTNYDFLEFSLKFIFEKTIPFDEQKSQGIWEEIKNWKYLRRNLTGPNLKNIHMIYRNGLNSVSFFDLKVVCPWFLMHRLDTVKVMINCKITCINPFPLSVSV